MLPLKNRTKRLYNHFNLSTTLLFSFSWESRDTFNVLADKYLKRKGFEKGFEKTYFPPQFLLKYVHNFYMTYILKKKGVT